MTHNLTIQLDKLWLELNRLRAATDHTQTHSINAQRAFAEFKRELEKETKNGKP